MAELKKDGIRAVMSEKTERETLKRLTTHNIPDSKGKARRCTCTFGVSRTCPLHATKKRRTSPIVETLSNSEPMDNNAFTARLHKIVHGSDDKCAYGGIGCPIRRDLKIEIDRSRASVAAPEGDAVLSAMWEALKREACKVPAEAQQIVFLGEEKFRKAMAPFAAASSPAPAELPPNEIQALRDENKRLRDHVADLNHDLEAAIKECNEQHR